MAQIVTAKGQVILVDDADYEFVNAITWTIHVRGYVRSDVMVNGKRMRLRLHRYLMGLAADDKRVVDHINGDPLDNRRQNLRVCNRFENMQNRGRTRTNTSGYKGVAFHPPSKKWRAAIGYNGRHKHLGLFEDIELAHEFYCLAADLIHGRFANHG